MIMIVWIDSVMYNYEYHRIIRSGSKLFFFIRVEADGLANRMSGTIIVLNGCAGNMASRLSLSMLDDCYSGFVI